MFRIGHLGDFNDLMLAGTLCGVEMGLALCGVPIAREASRRRSRASERAAGGDAAPAAIRRLRRLGRSGPSEPRARAA